MPNFEQHVDFDPDKEIPSLDGKVIFVTGGTSGLGRQTVKSLAQHKPAHIYFTGRNVEAGEDVSKNVHDIDADVGTTFIKMDMTSLADVKAACAMFVHDRLDILVCNAGIGSEPAGLSVDGYEKHFAVNHLAHAMIIRQLLPVLRRTAAVSEDSDVRVISITSAAWIKHPPSGITFDTLRTKQEGFMGGITRYAQSKIANIVYARALQHHVAGTDNGVTGTMTTVTSSDNPINPRSDITFVSCHPGAALTKMTTEVGWFGKIYLRVYLWWYGRSLLTVHQGTLSQLWCAAGAPKQALVNGGYYMPIGRHCEDRLDEVARSDTLRDELWDFTEKVLDEFGRTHGI